MTQHKKRQGNKREGENQKRRQLTRSAHHYLRRHVDIPGEVQSATSDTMQVPTNLSLMSPQRFKKIGGLSSFGVGARW